MDRDLDSIRFVTRHFKDLQGLRSMVPLGLLQLAPGIIAGFGGVPRLLPWIIGFQVVASVAAFFLMFSSRSYYRSYGHVEPKRAAFAKDPALSIFSPAGPAPQLAEGPPQSRRHLRFFLLVGAGIRPACEPACDRPPRRAAYRWLGARPVAAVRPSGRGDDGLRPGREGEPVSLVSDRGDATRPPSDPDRMAVRPLGIVPARHVADARSPPFAVLLPGLRPAVAGAGRPRRLAGDRTDARALLVCPAGAGPPLDRPDASGRRPGDRRPARPPAARPGARGKARPSPSGPSRPPARPSLPRTPRRRPSARRRAESSR